MRHDRIIARMVLIATIMLQGCYPAGTDSAGYPPPPSFAVTLGTNALSVTSGGTATTSIKATRSGGLTGTISYVMTGAPIGLVAAITNSTAPDSATLTITVAAALPAATYQLAVNASAIGAVDRQSTIAVTVTSAEVTVPVVTAIVAGAHTCALTTSGAAYCWGYNGSGELGNDAVSINNPAPIAVAGGLSFQSISVSKVSGVSCGLTITGAAYCWGDNSGGQLGDRTMTTRLHPTAVLGGVSFKSLAVGTSHVCAIAIDSTAWCWGLSPSGAFGNGATGEQLAPTPAAIGMTFQSVVAGIDYTCALTTGGAAYCWGVGTLGQLGNGDFASSTNPVAVTGGLTFRTLAAGAQTTCGLTLAGKAYCWGHNFFGTVGDGTTGTDQGSSRRLVPSAGVVGDLTFATISAGYQTICAVTPTGAAYCWGYNFGAIGDGTADHRAAPTAVAGGLTFRSVAGGTGYSCGITTDNAAYCWGVNTNGALGDGTLAIRSQPTPVRWPTQ